jgi:F-type H+-transporting ATPase subunit O
MIKRVEAAIAKSEYSQGKKLKVVTKVKPDILGGLIVEIGERTIDYSVASKMLKMNKMLQDAV